MKIRIISITATLFCLISFTASAGHDYINFDKKGNMVVSGPFNAVIPRPAHARYDGPVNSSPSFLDEKLNVSLAGFFADDQLILVQVETTNAAPGTLSNENLPTYELAGQEFRARKTCVDISQRELDADSDPLFEFIEKQNVQIVPAVNAVQLFVTNEDGTAEGKILYIRNVPGGCDSMTTAFKAEFDAAFERFVESVRDAN